MPRSANQKLKLLVLLRFLQRQSDEKHPVTMARMIEELARWDIPAERKSLYDDLEALRSFGADVITVRGRSPGYYLGERDFELPELKLLVDSIQSSKFITQRKTLSLIRKLEGLCSVYDAQLLERQVFVRGRVKSMNESVYYNVDAISDAISRDRQIRFRYFEFTLSGERRIFIAKIDERTKRYKLEHPGYPLNSQGDDFGMTFEGPYNRGFFCSNRGDGRGWDHIFSFENPEIVQTIKGWVYEMDGYELTAAQVHLVGDDGTNDKLSVRSDGSFTYVATPGVNYVLLATCRGYLNHKEELKVEQAEESEEYTLQFPLASITAPVLIANIFYDFDKATLRPESATALDELVGLLNENPNVTIELSAHCDYKGSAEYNKRLSQRRAESVVRYLIEHGIAADRLTPKGYGKEKPKTIRKKVAAKYKWLKEGDVLTEEFIKNQDEKNQETCNQLNRRTEFIVLRTTYGMFDEQGNLKNPPKPKQHVEENNNDGGEYELIIDE